MSAKAKRSLSYALICVSVIITSLLLVVNSNLFAQSSGNTGGNTGQTSSEECTGSGSGAECVVAGDPDPEEGTPCSVSLTSTTGTAKICLGESVTASGTDSSIAGTY